MVDIFYRGDGSITISGTMRKGEKKTYLGLCVYSSFFGTTEIYIDSKKIREVQMEGRRTGGNRVSPSPRIAIGMVLAHELQHANQHLIHDSSHSSFFGKDRSRYLTRSSEMEARQFADDNVRIISEILNEKLKNEIRNNPSVDEIKQVAESLAECDSVSVGDIVEELRLSGLNNAVNVSKVKELLADMGVQLR